MLSKIKEHIRKNDVKYDIEVKHYQTYLYILFSILMIICAKIYIIMYFYK